jgi:hypothetical protein
MTFGDLLNIIHEETKSLSTFWFYCNAGNAEGPYFKSQILAMLKENKITPDTLLWHKTLKQWRPLKECPIIAREVPDVPFETLLKIAQFNEITYIKVSKLISHSKDPL